MVNTIFILDRTYNTSQILVSDRTAQRSFWDDTYTQEFDTGAETFEFSCYLNEQVVEGNFVVFYYNNQYKMFTIMDIQQEHSEGKLVAHCYCEIASLSLLNNFVRPFNAEMNCIQFFEYILADTEWRIGKYSSSLLEKIQNIDVSSVQSVWSLIEDYKDVFGCEINVRATYENKHLTGFYIDIYDEGGLGSPTYKRFEYGRNVTGIIKKKELYDWCTAIIIDADCDVTNTVIGVNHNLGFTKEVGDVIVDDNANRMYNNGRNYIVGVYSGDETDPMEACINAWKELKKRSEPRFDYEVTTALTSDEYENLHLGDTVHVIDHSYLPPILLEARVGKLELSFTDKTRNSCTLTNYKEIKSRLLDGSAIKLTGTIADVVATFFPIGSEGIQDGAIVDGKINTTYYNEITADIVSAGIGAFEELYVQGMTVINADIENLTADKASIKDLEAINANIEKLTVGEAQIQEALIGKADISQLNATNATIETLKAEKATVTELNAAKANIGNLQADVAEINTLVNGNLTSDNIHSLILTTDKVSVADAFIKSAMIDSISANKITSGAIDTSKVNIKSSDGSMTITGSLQQFKDKNGKVRIQIGKDAQGNFTFSLFDTNGTGVLIDQNGITKNAIADGLIVNDMVADNANIDGGKLDIDSVITEVNNGTSTIKGSKVKLDGKNQTLDVSFNELNTTVSSVNTKVTNATTSISAQQGQINTLISDTTITKDGSSVKLKDAYNSTVATVNSLSTKISSVESTANSVSSKQTSLEANLSGFKTTVASTYVSKTDANNTYATKSQIEQTNKDWSAAFQAGYEQGIVKMNKNGITVTHSGTDRYTQMNATGFTSYHKDGYSVFNADGLFRYVENPNDMNSQEFRYLTLGTTGLITFGAEYGSQVSIELPGIFDHMPSNEIEVMFVFNCPYHRDADKLLSYYDVPARAYSAGWYKNSDGHWQHDELYCTLVMYDMNTGETDYAAGYVMYYAFA